MIDKKLKTILLGLRLLEGLFLVFCFYFFARKNPISVWTALYHILIDILLRSFENLLSIQIF
jgi:hypothetical protein